MKKKGKFIVIDGGDGAGKSSAIAYLKKQLKGRKVVFTREPRGTEFGAIVTKALFTEKYSETTALFAMLAARAHHIDQVIAPALRRGYTVICDRYDSTTFAYQIYQNPDPYAGKMFRLAQKSFEATVKPDHYIFLDVDPRLAVKRLRARKDGQRGYDVRPLSFHTRLREGYVSFLRTVPHTMIDANTKLDTMNRVVEETFTRLHI